MLLTSKPVLIFLIIVTSALLTTLRAQHQTDTTYLSYERLQQKILWHYRYDQTLVLKLLMSTASFDGKYKKKDNGTSEVFLTFTDALEVIKRIDNITLGMPKIIYLVGWQYNGHDSKYPAWFEGNVKLKRKEDNTALESLRWLMKEARKYHTSVSLHINMFDAYEDSPLWDEYVKNDIIAKNKDGSVLTAEWGSPVSYAQEWKTGFAQKRIDSLCRLLPLKEAGTIHIDAFHTWPPIPVADSNGTVKIDLAKKITSPFLSFTIADETEAQRKIFKYWASKGVDVTSEGTDFLREDNFQGYQPMAWWFTGLQNYKRWPSSVYTGGVDRSTWGKLFGTSMHGEDIVKKDKNHLTGFKEQFCLNTTIWYYLNQLERKYVVDKDSYKAAGFSGNVSTSYTTKGFLLKSNNDTLVYTDNVLMPASWLGNNYLIAYSKTGYKEHTWALDGGFPAKKIAVVYSISIDGKKKMGSRKISGNKIMLSLEPDEMLLLELL